MTVYSTFGDTTILATYDTGRAWRTERVTTATTEDAPALAGAMTRLSRQMWYRYTEPSSAAGSTAVNTEGWRRQKSERALDQVPEILVRPNLPDEHGVMLQEYEPTLEYAHRLGRVLHWSDSPEVTAAVVAEVRAEIDAVHAARRGNLTGRAAQALSLSRPEVSPVQVAAADEVLRENPLAANALFGRVEPAAAAVSAARWLFAAAVVSSQASGVPIAAVVQTADDIEALPTRIPTEVLELLADGDDPVEFVPALIIEALAVGHGEIPDPPRLRDEFAEARRQARAYTRAGHKITEDSLLPDRVCLLDPVRPALDLLEDLLTGIRGAFLLWREYQEPPDDLDDDASEHWYDELEESFAEAVRDRVDTLI